MKTSQFNLNNGNPMNYNYLGNFKITLDYHHKKNTFLLDQFTFLLTSGMYLPCFPMRTSTVSLML